MFGKEKYCEINSVLNEKLKKKGTLVVQHRGAHTGNIPQNTSAAFKTSFLLGADMFEFDVSLSTDGILYCFHDTTERENLGMKRNIQTYSSVAIKEFELYNSIWEPSGFEVERAESVLQTFSGDELFNIDRSWNVLPSVFALLKKYPNSIRQAILKAPVKKEILDAYENESTKFMFMPIVRSREDVDTVLAYENINVVGLECIVKDSNDEFFSDEFINEMHERGLFLWVNALTLSSQAKHIMSAGYDDNESLLNGFDKGWGVLIGKKYDIIQTDWPELLSAYVKEKAKNRK